MRTIKEIETLLKQEVVPLEEIETLKTDTRKGVIAALKRYTKKQLEKEKEEAQFQWMSRYEEDLWAQGFESIAGIDEVGRGPLAGAVVAAAVILPKDFKLVGLNDSKKLSEAKRDEFYEYILTHCLAYGIGIVSAEEIDKINIYEGTKVAMNKAINQLKVKPSYLLIDAMKLDNDVPQQSIIKGDANSISIAAASVVAKVTRDRMMKELGKKHQQYGFERHMGYGTKEHLDAIEKYGVLDEHRRSFAPIKEVLKKG